MSSKIKNKKDLREYISEIIAQYKSDRLNTDKNTDPINLEQSLAAQNICKRYLAKVDNINDDEKSVYTLYEDMNQALISLAISQWTSLGNKFG